MSRLVRYYMISTNKMSRANLYDNCIKYQDHCDAIIGNMCVPDDLSTWANFEVVKEIFL